MFPRHLSVLLVSLALLLPIGASEDAAPFAPLAVAALGSLAADTVVTWVPGEVPADAYLVYGMNPGEAPMLLHEAEAQATFAPVDGSFATYGVAGVHNGEVSPLVFAAGTMPPPEIVCVWAALEPEPYVAVCKLPRLPLKFLVPRLP